MVCNWRHGWAFFGGCCCSSSTHPFKNMGNDSSMHSLRTPSWRSATSWTCRYRRSLWRLQLLHLPFPRLSQSLRSPSTLLPPDLQAPWPGMRVGEPAPLPPSRAAAFDVPVHRQAGPALRLAHRSGACQSCCPAPLLLRLCALRDPRRRALTCFSGLAAGFPGGDQLALLTPKVLLLLLCHSVELSGAPEWIDLLERWTDSPAGGQPWKPAAMGLG